MPSESNDGRLSLLSILRSDRNASGFREALQEVLGEFEEWEDEGDVYFTAKLAGIEVLTDAAGGVSAIFLFGPGSEEGDEYRGPLPAGLHFGLSRDQVRSLLGDPDESGEPQVFLGDVICPWDKYRLPDFRVHARYVLDGSRISRVTLEP